MTSTKNLTAAGLAMLLIAAAIAAGWTVLATSADPDGFTERPGVILGDGASRRAGATANDWVTNADHVVAVSITSETERPPSAAELKRGEGLIFRNLTFKVDKVLWSSTKAAHAAPSSFPWLAFGWQFINGDTTVRTRVGADGSPRFERGHQYVLAIEWVPDCSAAGRGRWEGISPDAIVPFDRGVLGAGETAGRVVKVADVRRSTSVHAGLKEKVARGNAKALVSALRAATARSAEQSQRLTTVRRVTATC